MVKAAKHILGSLAGPGHWQFSALHWGEKSGELSPLMLTLLCRQKKKNPLFISDVEAPFNVSITHTCQTPPKRIEEEGLFILRVTWAVASAMWGFL